MDGSTPVDHVWLVAAEYLTPGRWPEDVEVYRVTLAGPEEAETFCGRDDLREIGRRYYQIDGEAVVVCALARGRRGERTLACYGSRV